MKVSAQGVADMDKKSKRAEKMAVSERLTNGFMLTLTYGLAAILLLEIARRHYLKWDMDAWNFASKYSIVLGVIFALGVVGALVWGAIKKNNGRKALGYTAFFAVASVVSFFISYDARLPISRAMMAKKTDGWGMVDFMANLNLARDIKFVEYGVAIYIALAFVLYAVKLARIEKKK